MDVIITSAEPIKATITSPKPDIIEVINNEPVKVVVSLIKDGKSAYQSAVDNGFVGSEADWINLLENPNIDGGLIF